MSNPYTTLDDFCFWSRAMTWPAPGQIDPVVSSAEILPHEKVATMGSCFAQHLASHIKASGLNYFVAEQPPVHLNEKESKARNFGVFSARYGNVYTVRQAIQLFDRAFGDFCPVDDVWSKDAKFVDAFRPQIEPGGYESIEDVRESARQHLEYVKDVFSGCDWLVFTLGLTEAWKSRRDGAIYPTAPGVAGGTFDPELYEFVNFTATEVQSDLSAFIRKVREINPRVRILLTVSPVPLIATYERRHVWVSTTYSKAALRVAADAVEREFEKVIYFPSYETITSPASGSRYYADDLRQVTETGVKHVMKIFERHFFPKDKSLPRTFSTTQQMEESIKNDSSIVCDEEVIESALRNSGFNRP